MKNIQVGGSSNYQVVAFSKGEIFFAKYMQPDNVGTFAEQDGKNREKLTFTSAAIAVVEGLHASGRGCKHMRFVRNDRKAEGVQGLGFVQIKHWPKLRVALNHAGVERAHAQGGFENALAYRDEVAVPDYSVSGASGWIVPKKDIGRYLDALPPLPKDNEVLRKIYSEETGSGSPDTFKAVLYGSMYPKTKLTWHNRPAGCRDSYNTRELCEITFDEGSRKVKRIVRVETGEELKDTCIRYCSGVQTFTHAKVGERLPDWAVASWEDPTGVWKISEFLNGICPEGADEKLPTQTAWTDLYERSQRLCITSTPQERPNSWVQIKDILVKGADEYFDRTWQINEEKEARGGYVSSDAHYCQDAWLHNFEDLARLAGFRVYDDQPCGE